VLALAATLLALPANAFAQEIDDPRVFVLWLDATTLDDWAATGPGPLAAMTDAGVASVATPPAILDPIRAALAAAETVGAGRILNGAPTTDRRGTPLLIGLAAFGLESAILSGAPETIPATVARAFGPVDAITSARFARADPQFPGGARTNVTAMADAVTASSADVVIAQIPDVLVAELSLGSDATARASWVAQTVERAQTVLAAMQEAADGTDLVIAVSPTPSGPRRAEHIALGAIAIAGNGVPSGPLRSPTTSRDGLVSLTDVAPTILAWFGLSRDDVDRGALPRYADAPPGFAGSAIGGVEGEGLERARAVEADLIEAARAHNGAARSFAIAGIVLALLAAGTVLSGRGAPPRPHRFPRGWRDGLATASVAFVLYAPALLLAPPLVAAIIAIAAGMAALAVLGRERALIVALLSCTALPMADIASGGGLIAASALPTPIAGGLRVRALDPVVLGMILAGVAGIGALLDRMRSDERAPLWPLSWGAAAVFLAGTHGAGGDVGAVLALAPAALMLAVIVAGARLERLAIAGVVAATIAAAGLVTLTFGPALWVDQDPLIPQAAVPNLVGRRVDVFVDQLSSIWLPVLVLAAASLLLLALRRRSLLGRGLWGMPFFRAGLAAMATGAAITVVTVRGGLAAAGVTAVLLAAAAFIPLLAPER